MIASMSSLGARNGALDGYWGEVKSAGQHLRVFAEAHSLSYLAGVFDEIRKQKVAQEVVGDLDAAMRRAEELATNYLRYRGTDALVKVEWQLKAQSKTAS